MVAFLDKVDCYFNSFRDLYKKDGDDDLTYHPGYSQDPDPDYDWSWKEFIEFIMPESRTESGRPSSDIWGGN